MTILHACLGLQEALQKTEDYMNEEISLKGKIDGDSLQLMKDYFGKITVNTPKLTCRNHPLRII